jgi:hypothetical protein
VSGKERSELASALRWQAAFCHRTGAPLYGLLLDRSAEDVEAGGPAWELLRPHAADPPTSALALRLMGAVHRLVLEGLAPDLAPFYPTAGGTGQPSDAWVPFRTILQTRAEALRPLVARPCQTNEVGRAAGLLPGFLAVARETGLPLRLLEVGASAGLNLRWDSYRYEGGGLVWGDPASLVRITEAFAGPVPLDGRPAIAERSGCDLHPLDPGLAEDRLRLMSSVWADQPERLERLRPAFDVAASVPAAVDEASAAPWLERRLATPREGVATVVFHSVVLQYLDQDERLRMFDLVEEAGARATPNAPFAWLRFESGDWRRTTSHEVRLTVWPGGEERKLAEAGPHGPPVIWTGS